MDKDKLIYIGQALNELSSIVAKTLADQPVVIAPKDCLGWCAVLLTPDGEAYFRSRITTKVQAEITARQWYKNYVLKEPNKYTTAAIQQVLGTLPIIVNTEHSTSTEQPNKE